MSVIPEVSLSRVTGLRTDVILYGGHLRGALKKLGAYPPKQLEIMLVNICFYRIIASGK